MPVKQDALFHKKTRVFILCAMSIAFVCGVSVFAYKKLSHDSKQKTHTQIYTDKTNTHNNNSRQHKLKCATTMSEYVDNVLYNNEHNTQKYNTNKDKHTHKVNDNNEMFKDDTDYINEHKERDAIYKLMTLQDMRNRSRIYNTQDCGELNISTIILNINAMEAMLLNSKYDREKLLRIFLLTDAAVQRKLNKHNRKIDSLSYVYEKERIYKLNDDMYKKYTAFHVINSFFNRLMYNSVYKTYNIHLLSSQTKKYIKGVNDAYSLYISLSSKFYVMHFSDIELVTQLTAHKQAKVAYFPFCTVYTQRKTHRILKLHDITVATQHSGYVYRRYTRNTKICAYIKRPLRHINDEYVSHTAVNIINIYFSDVLQHNVTIQKNVALIIGEYNYILHSENIGNMHDVRVVNINDIHNAKNLINMSYINVYFGHNPLTSDILHKLCDDSSVNILHDIQSNEFDKGTTIAIQHNYSDILIVSSATSEHSQQYYTSIYDIPIGSLMFKQCAEVLACILHEIIYKVQNKQSVEYEVKVFTESDNHTHIWTLIMTQTMKAALNTIKKMCVDVNYIRQLMHYDKDSAHLNDITKAIETIQKLQITIVSYAPMEIMRNYTVQTSVDSQKIESARAQCNLLLKQHKDIMYIWGDICEHKICEHIDDYINGVLFFYAEHSALRRKRMQHIIDAVYKRLNTMLQNVIQKYEQHTQNMSDVIVLSKIPYGFGMFSMTHTHDIPTDISTKGIVKLVDILQFEKEVKKFIQNKKLNVHITIPQLKHFQHEVNTATDIEAYIIAMHHINDIRNVIFAQ